MMEELGVNVNRKEEEAHPAIVNCDVLEKIFSFLKPNNVKEARLVCRVWETVAKKELGNQQMFLVINKLDFGNLEHGKILVVLPHFVRRIKIHLGRGSTEHSPLCVDNFLPFLTFHRNKIEEILFEGQDNFLRPIKTVLEAVEFPNLRKISLHELDQEEKRYVPGTYRYVSVPDEFRMPRLSIILNTVTSLEFCPSQYEFETNDCLFHGSKVANGRNFPLFQEIIKKCPNLEGLTVFRQFYPDLSNCLKLKSLEWVGPSSKMVFNEGRPNTIMFDGFDLDIPRLVEMLIPIKDRLENLSLGSPVDLEAEKRDLNNLGSDLRSKFIPRGSPLWRDLVEYPSMPKLTKLFVSDVNVFGISYDWFYQNRHVSLKTLILRSTQKYEFPIRELVSDCSDVVFDESYNNVEVKLESLSLNQFPLGEVRMWEEISSTFPNLKELSLGFTTEREIRDLTAEMVSNPGKLQNTLTAISRNIVNLEKLTIEIKFPCTFYGLMDAIYINSFKDSNLDSKKVSLKLVAPDQRLIPDPRLITKDGSSLDGPPKIWESLLIYKSLTFQGFRIREETRNKMQDFVVERDLKDVYFLQ